MRLFIAIELNDEMKNDLEGMQSYMKRCGVKGNYTKRENFHLTLAFIGEYDDPELAADAIRSADLKPFDIRFSGAGSFGRLWWAGIDGGKALTAYVSRLRKALDTYGIPFDRKKFLPHITLIRKPEYSGGRDAEKKLLEAVRNGSFAGSGQNDTAHGSEHSSGSGLSRGSGMRVENVTLMRSDRGEHGMIYTPLTRI